MTFLVSEAAWARTVGLSRALPLAPGCSMLLVQQKLQGNLGGPATSEFQFLVRTCDGLFFSNELLSLGVQPVPHPLSLEWSVLWGPVDGADY